MDPGLQSQSIIYRVKKGEEEKAFKWVTDPKQPVGELFLDPNLFSIDSTTAIAFTAISNSGTYMAYGLYRSGSDTYTVYVRHTDCPHTKTAANGGKRGEDPGWMKDIVENVRMTGVNWMRDDSAEAQEEEGQGAAMVGGVGWGGKKGVGLMV
ncbi:hypothetical protein PTTG_26522 [Puccinia triticina 1-1 BBBD Race 1]|uniref:Peptidase_S9_N domain-containing protein n=1 Tax=Puccinia triticina (isolate 1-1 / race 1 (BBBD)) TaxID=630390 RepID=A0A180GTF0_PUCT1|nr:hypothetical protein PTTG_26522 [Puccinia triticina 1-1 BBBD Race 1]